MCLSPNWHYLVLDGMDQAFKRVECGFINQYYEHLLFKRSYTNSSVIYVGGKRGIRLDRVIVCEVLHNSKHLNKCLQASFAYKLQLEKQKPMVIGPGKIKVNREQTMKAVSQEHMASYKLDIVRDSSQRLVWIHRDEQEEQTQISLYEHKRDILGKIMQRPLTQPIMQIC